MTTQPAGARAPEAVAASGRMQWMDLLRGVAILLVLVWHAPAVPALYGYVIPGWVLAANDALLPFRMPTLMLLSGLLLPRSLSKPLPTYVLGKLRLLAWPYVLWAALHMVVYEAVAPMWHPRAWIATGYLWFLFFLMCYYAAAPLLRWSRIPAAVLPVALFAASVPAPEGIATKLLYFAGFFFTGSLVGRHPGLLEAAVRRRWVVQGCAALAVAGGALSVVVDTRYQGQYAVLGLAGIVVAVAAAQRVQGRRWAGPLCAVGRHSVVFYVSHFPVMIAVVTAGTALGVRSLGVTAAVGLGAALVVGAAFARWRRHPGVGWLFEAPRPRRRAPSVTVGAAAPGPPPPAPRPAVTG